MMLDYKGIAYEAIERCYSLDRNEDLRCVNDRAEVPTLVLDDGSVIADSTIIGEYLEDAFPNPPLFPRHPLERAKMRKIDDLCDRSFDAVTFGYFFGELRSNPAMKEAAVSEFRALFEILERELGGRNFFCGDLSMADFAAICHVPLLRVTGIGFTRFSAPRFVDDPHAGNPGGARRPAPPHQGGRQSARYRERVRRPRWTHPLARQPP